jgi:hypothetical protein
MERGRWTVLGLVALLVGLSGCSGITITFKIEDVINDGGRGDRFKEMLDVDIVCLSSKDIERFPELAEGTLNSREWFSARDAREQKYRALDGQIYALRSGEAGSYDLLKGPALVSAANTGKREVVVRELKPPRKILGESAIVVFGRFHDGTGRLLGAQPVLIRPLPRSGRIAIGVGRTQMTLLKAE